MKFPLLDVQRIRHQTWLYRQLKVNPVEAVVRQVRWGKPGPSKRLLKEVSHARRGNRFYEDPPKEERDRLKEEAYFQGQVHKYRPRNIAFELRRELEREYMDYKGAIEARERAIVGDELRSELSLDELVILFSKKLSNSTVIDVPIPLEQSLPSPTTTTTAETTAETTTTTTAETLPSPSSTTSRSPSGKSGHLSNEAQIYRFLSCVAHAPDGVRPVVARVQLQMVIEELLKGGVLGASSIAVGHVLYNRHWKLLGVEGNLSVARVLQDVCRDATAARVASERALKLRKECLQISGWEF